MRLTNRLLKCRINLVWIKQVTSGRWEILFDLHRFMRRKVRLHVRGRGRTWWFHSDADPSTRVLVPWRLRYTLHDLWKALHPIKEAR